MGKGVAFNMKDFGDASNAGGGLCGGLGIQASDQHMHLTAALGGGGHGVQGGGANAGVVVFGNYESGHFWVPWLFEVLR